MSNLSISEELLLEQDLLEQLCRMDAVTKTIFLAYAEAISSKHRVPKTVAMERVKLLVIKNVTGKEITEQDLKSVCTPARVA